MTSSRYSAPELKDLPVDLQERILQVQEKIGFVPNVFITLAHRPAEWRAFFAYHDALMAPESVGRESGLTKGEREMIVTTTSALNHCLYCVVAHGAILRIYEKNPLLSDQVSTNYRKANLNDRQNAMLEFAIKVCEKAHEIDDSDFQKLHQVGFNDEDIWDIAAITAFFGMSNRLANFTSMQPNTEFYMLGRTRKN
jgi:uncharacterized peroxidase-related enzyme